MKVNTSHTIKTLNTTNALKKLHLDAPKNQYLREMVVNSMEALEGFDDKQIKIYPCPEALKMGVGRLCIADNGKGMTPSEMRSLLFNLHSSSKSTTAGDHENFGVGVKATTYYGNPYGVVFLSWTKDNPEGTMAWITYDPETNQLGGAEISYSAFNEWDEEYGMTLPSAFPLKTKPLEEGEDEDMVPVSLERVLPEGFEGVKWWDCKPDFIKEHGTVVILCGSHREDSTYKEGMHRYLLQYLTSRFWDLNDYAISVYGLDGKVKRACGYSEFQFASVTTESEEVVPYLIDSCEVEAPGGFKVKVFITESVSDMKGASKSNRFSLRDRGFEESQLNSGSSAVLYQNELYHHASKHGEMTKWGINIPSVYPQVKLIVEPPLGGPDLGCEGVYPAYIRDSLKWYSPSSEESDSDVVAPANLDLSGVQEWFRSNLPPMLVSLLKDATSRMEVSSKDMDKMYSKYKPLLSFVNSKVKTSKVKETPDGSEAFNPEDGFNPSGNTRTHERTNVSGSRDGAVKVGAPDSQGSLLGSPVRVKRKDSNVIFTWSIEEAGITEDLFMEGGIEFPFLYLGQEGVSSPMLYGNPNHKIFQDTIHHFVMETENGEVYEKQIAEIVLEVFKVQALMFVAHRKQFLRKYRKSFEVSKGELLSAISGVWLIYTQIRSDLSNKRLVKKKG
jgi:hypothetical protein